MFALICVLLILIICFQTLSKVCSEKCEKYKTFGCFDDFWYGQKSTNVSVLYSCKYYETDFRKVFWMKKIVVNGILHL